MIDITGAQFGRLTALSVFGRDARGEIIWSCRCACGNERTASSSCLRSGRAWHCGCVPQTRLDLSHRFWAKVDKSGECWLWTATRDPKGYGRIMIGKTPTLAHRVSWELSKGPIPDGLCVLHNCPTGDNPTCVNPAHLFLGTIADNNRDMMAKGRHRCQVSMRAFCKRGHSLSPGNTWTNARGARRCKKCALACTAAYREGGYRATENARARELYALNLEKNRTKAREKARARRKAA